MSPTDDGTPILYDENGEPVEGALPPDKVEELKSAADKATELETELNKLRDKDINFSKFREKTKEEQIKIKEEMSARERMLLEEIESLRRDTEARNEATLGRYKEERLTQLVGTDEKLKEKVQAAIDRLGGNPLSKEEVDDLYADALAIAQRRVEESTTVNPLFQGGVSFNTQSPWGNGQKKNYADSSEGQALAKDLGLTIEDPNKK